jgi:pimeloyl-ACP methyl ester carboxylesterase
MRPRKLHTYFRPAVGTTRHPPLLFVHGGFVSASCWGDHFLPFFSHRGFDCHAVDLSGHGSSEGRERIDTFGLDDYVDDVAQVAASLERPPVLIGHSMGAAIVERYLERRAAAAAVLMAPVPVMGTLASTMKLALTEPDFFTEVTRAAMGQYTAKTLRIVRDVYYSPDMKPEALLSMQHHFQSESSRAVTDLSMLGWRVPRRRASLPTLVVGGECDAIFPPGLLHFTAARWKAKVVVVERAGHTIMLDVHWKAAAEHIAHWLETQDRG